MCFLPRLGRSDSLTVQSTQHNSTGQCYCKRLQELMKTMFNVMYDNTNVHCPDTAYNALCNVNSRVLLGTACFIPLRVITY